MRALTGYDRVTLTCGDGRAESSRGAFSAPSTMADDLPPIVADCRADAIHVFPRQPEESSLGSALLCSCDHAQSAALEREGVRASLRIPFSVDGISGEFRCESRTARDASFELHAAAELFAQLFAMRLQIDTLKNR